MWLIDFLDYSAFGMVWEEFWFEWYSKVDERAKEVEELADILNVMLRIFKKLII